MQHPSPRLATYFWLNDAFSLGMVIVFPLFVSWRSDVRQIARLSACEWLRLCRYRISLLLVAGLGWHNFWIRPSRTLPPRFD